MLIFSFGGLLLSGLVGVIQKVFVYDYAQTSLNNFLTVAFALILVIGGVCLWIAYGLERKNALKKAGAQAESSRTERGWKLFFVVGVGVLIAVINIINTYLSGRLPSAVVFPVINGGSIFLTTIMSVLFFKEKPTKSQAIGLSIGVLAILVIALA